MSDLWLVGIAGFSAALVDGALGMGVGPTSSSILLGTGLSPASVSTTVNLAKVATGIAAAISHWRFRNIDHKLVLKLAIPGALGALVGVTILSNVDADVVKPALAALLILIGLRILWRFSRPVTAKAEEFEDLEGDPDKMPPFDDRGVELVATAGGVTNGMIGAWGPVVTPFLMGRQLAPRFAVGSVNTAEVAVAAVSATSLIAAVGKGGLDIGVIIAMLLGGTLAAPVAAWAVCHIPPRPMGVAVGGLLLITNARELSNSGDLGPERWIAYGLVVVLVALAALRPRLTRTADPVVR
jgi:uncharacterized membrane protein YfcA